MLRRLRRVEPIIKQSSSSFEMSMIAQLSTDLLEDDLLLDTSRTTRSESSCKSGRLDTASKLDVVVAVENTAAGESTVPERGRPRGLLVDVVDDEDDANNTVALRDPDALDVEAITFSLCTTVLFLLLSLSLFDLYGVELT